MKQFEQTVSPEANGQRLDVFASTAAQVTRSRVQQLIEQGLVSVNGQPMQKAGLKLCCGQTVRVALPPPVEATVAAEALPLSILYEDADVAVIDKPCGMVVHPAAGNAHGTLVHALLYHLADLSGIGGVLRPGIVHRLDKDTSGVLLVAKNDAAHQSLSAQLKARSMRKTYAALAQGNLRDDAGSIDAPIARDPKNRKRMAIVSDGRASLTRYEVAGRLPGSTLLKVGLMTGRTHQIRVHLRSIGHPLVGDPVYGSKGGVAAPRLMLHAQSIAFDQPSTGQRIAVAAPWPPEYLAVLDKLCRQQGADLKDMLQIFDEG